MCVSVCACVFGGPLGVFFSPGNLSLNRHKGAETAFDFATHLPFETNLHQTSASASPLRPSADEHSKGILTRRCQHSAAERLAKSQQPALELTGRMV